MGIPSDVIAASSRASYPVQAGAASSRESVHLGGVGVVLPGPPPGFTRIASAGGEGGLGALNDTGGIADWAVLVGGNRLRRRTNHADQEWSGVFDTYFLPPGVDLEIDLYSGGGGNGLKFWANYVDIPIERLIAVNIAGLSNSGQILIPAAAPGKAHCLQMGAEEAIFNGYNDDASSRTMLLGTPTQQYDERVINSASNAFPNWPENVLVFRDEPMMGQQQEGSAETINLNFAYYPVDRAAA